jgi:hypothetical protein
MRHHKVGWLAAGAASVRSATPSPFVGLISRRIWRKPLTTFVCMLVGRKMESVTGEGS